jgi:UPF0755 protein
MKKFVAFLVVLIFGTTVGVGWFFFHTYADNAGPLEQEIVFEVRPGMTLASVAKELAKQNIIKKPSWFLVLAKIEGQSNRMKVGEYQFVPDISPREVLEVITSGRSIGRNFTIAEGLNLFEISELYESEELGRRDDFWKWTHDKNFINELLGERQSSLEGYLFPETYQVTKYTDVKSLIRAMVARFFDVYRRDIESLMADQNLTRHQVVTLASIVEKETGAPEERPLISGVFHNRLRKKMMLQTDPTVIYGKAVELGKLVISITRADLTKPTEYNTYVIKGLPPGPIANPGKLALLAALQPKESEFIFFVSQNDGTHIFSKDLKAHNQAVQTYQVDAKARSGKSWRDLKKSRPEAKLQR